MRFVFILLLACCSTSVGLAKTITEAEREFFESKIRPVLIEHCYQCHNSTDSAEGGLVVDHREALLRGGDGGAVIVDGDPAASRLIKVLRHEIDGLEMPEGGPKLDEQVVRDFERWIRIGMPDPRDEPPSGDELRESNSWAQTLQRRRQWWSLQPIMPVEPPDRDDSANPVDRFINAAVESNGLEASPAADTATLVRRLSFAIVGLPPSPDDAKSWTRRIETATDRDTVVGELIDELLASHRFGQRWARHWMDWIRYAESHGSEGDPGIENAWHYRDYLIRALNQDVPYDQLIKEHIAGDLLPAPRINTELGINESAIGTAHWRMVFHGFAPTDALDEKVRFIDDEINVFSKAFLGLTVSCARCHDHKFDAISQADYYALFGVLASCRPGRNVVDVQPKQELHRATLAELKLQIRDAIASQWLDDCQEAAERFIKSETNAGKPSGMVEVLGQLRKSIADGRSFPDAWKQLVEEQLHRRAAVEAFFGDSDSLQWDLADADAGGQWHSYGIGLEGPSLAGQFSIADDDQGILTGIYPAGVYTHGLSTKHPGRLTSPDFDLAENQAVVAEVIGENDASLRYVVQDYPRSGTVYPVMRLNGDWRFQRYDLSYWSGDSIHLELATAMDAPLLTSDRPRSWFGVRRIVVADKDHQVPESAAEGFLAVAANAQADLPENWSDVQTQLQSTIEAAVAAWRSDSMTDEQAVLLDDCLKIGALPNSLPQLPELSALVSRYRSLENEIPVPTRVPGLEESVGTDQPLMVRGSHKHLADPVPRRFLEVIDDSPYDSPISGRAELAEDLLRDDNPLTKRVIVNRIWHHLFGRGLVSTPNNFGRLGNPPSHPELLDYLATRFAREGWSIKNLIRLIVSSQSWQRSSMPLPGVQEADPENVYLARANVRRLEAESIRDSLLSVSGNLDDRLGGPPVPASSPRRSVYVRVIRNNLDPFLRAFDFPEPFSSVGRRDVTNVPAQSLAIMNDAQITGIANDWTRQTLAVLESEGDQRAIEQLFLQAFSRQPTEREIDQARTFIAEMQTEFDRRGREGAELESHIKRLESSINARWDVARERLGEDAELNGASPTTELPVPIGHWDFTEGLEDRMGHANVTLKGGAVQNESGLMVRDGGYAVTAPIDVPISQKTMEVWLKLANLEQRAGGAITLQSPDGVQFDAIVFAERDAGQWLAGSNNFRRTEPFGGSRETSADREVVHVAITYDAQGTITGYRNGQPYGKSYRSDGPLVFAAGRSIVGFGVRHLPAGGNRLLSGTILEARLYDHALSAEQIAASAEHSASFVSEELLLKQLTEVERTEMQRDRASLAELTRRLKSIPQSKFDAEGQAWSELARALLSFKEFIYVR
ncbi:Planctomycete cytochrome C [Stieleria maiorica]|uniref:Planctomycete cytochrome C n=1 Tax=Stieleria maiorica TaxID=2795974 RepID=A0A5B9MDY5_9BACT|nr:DUF1553 domain-containing protein [Stieleria maiorica]QEF99013.1 Planctomycete cytochrome C [Stieleria maiorica]